MTISATLFVDKDQMTNLAELASAGWNPKAIRSGFSVKLRMNGERYYGPEGLCGVVSLRAAETNVATGGQTGWVTLVTGISGERLTPIPGEVVDDIVHGYFESPSGLVTVYGSVNSESTGVVASVKITSHQWLNQCNDQATAGKIKSELLFEGPVESLPEKLKIFREPSQLAIDKARTVAVDRELVFCE